MKLTSGAGPSGEATRIARGGSTGSIAGMVNHLTWAGVRGQQAMSKASTTSSGRR
jgi:hypothetical protein